MLRPEHCLRLLPATALAFAAASAPFSCPLSRPRRGTTRLRLPHRRALHLGGKPSSTLRAPAMPDAAVAPAPEMPQREVARALAEQAVARLGPWLLPSAVPDDVAEFRNAAGNAVGSLDVRRGAPGSSVHTPFLRPVVEPQYHTHTHRSCCWFGSSDLTVCVARHSIRA